MYSRRYRRRSTYKRRTRKYHKRRLIKGRGYRTKASGNNYTRRSVQFNPDRLTTTVAYIAGHEFADSAGNNQYTWRGNSIYDPDWAVGGKTVSDYNKLGVMYNEYIVHGSKCELTIYPKKEAAISVALTPTLTGTKQWTNISAAKRQTNTKTKYSAYGSSKPIRMKYFMKTKRMFWPEPADALWSATMTADPIRQWFWQLIVEDDTVDSPVVPIKCDIKITYYVTFYNKLIGLEGNTL